MAKMAAITKMFAEPEGACANFGTVPKIPPPVAPPVVERAMTVRGRFARRESSYEIPAAEVMSLVSADVPADPSGAFHALAARERLEQVISRMSPPVDTRWPIVGPVPQRRGAGNRDCWGGEGQLHFSRAAPIF